MADVDMADGQHGGAPASSSASAASVAGASSSAASSSGSSLGARSLLALRVRLSAVGTPVKAAGMQKYMKSTMPFHGVMTPEARAINREVLAGVTFANADEWSATIRHMWDHATHREERYGALHLARSSASDAYRTEVAALDLYRYLASTGQWWDFIDTLSASHIGDVLRAHPAEAKVVLKQWSQTDDMWLRRCAILSQLNSKGREMDLAFLFDMIRPARASPEFFLRKAIGWALRQAVREFPTEVAEYVRENESQLSGLSVKEALKHLGGTVAAATRITGKKRSSQEANTQQEEEAQEDDAAAAAAAAAGAPSVPASSSRSAPSKRRKTAASTAGPVESPRPAALAAATKTRSARARSERQ